MPFFQVTGIDEASGHEDRMSVEISSVRDAAEFAEKRGLRPILIQDSNKQEYRLTSCGWESVGRPALGSCSPKNTDENEEHVDDVLFVISFLIPLVGIIAGSIRLANRDPSGKKFVVASVIGMILSAIIIAAVLNP